MTGKFRKILIAEPGKDFGALAGLAADTSFVCKGFEQDTEQDREIDKALTDFDPEQDAVVPVGRLSVVTRLFLELGRRYPEHRVVVGVYQHQNGEYQWQTI